MPSFRCDARTLVVAFAAAVAACAAQVNAPTGAGGQDGGGQAGTSGVAGATGTAGVTGAAGTTGSAGVTGTTGVAGTTGTAGGPAGTTGGAGATGSAGAGGAAGATGRAGTTGGGGTTGVAGTTGTAGTTGSAGRGGTSGTAGTTGGAGRGGASGTAGVTGGAGTTGTAGTGGGPVNLNGRKALFILDDPGSPDDGDIILRLTLENRGMVVTYGPPEGPASLATGQHVVIVSSGASASDWTPIFKDVAVPMVVFGNSAYQQLGWIAGSSARGTVDSTAPATLVTTSTPLAADLMTGVGFKLVLDSRDTSLYWGTPAAGGIRVASIMGAADQLVVFAYERGAMTAMGSAPARRVGLGFRTDVVQDLTIEGFKLMNAAIEWTAGSN